MIKAEIKSILEKINIEIFNLTLLGNKYNDKAYLVNIIIIMKW